MKERQYPSLPEESCWLPTHVLGFFKDCKWSSDPWNGVYDYVSRPEKFFLTKSGDCDDYALFACTMLIRPSNFLTVSWMEENGTLNGHAVCVYQDSENKWWHLGNWGLRGPFNSLVDVCKSIQPPKATCLLCTLRDRELGYIRSWRI